MARGQRAIHYHAFAAAPLVIMASILDFNSKKLKLLVEFTYHSILNPQDIEKRTGVKQEAVKDHNLAWLNVYLRREPNSEMSSFLNSKGALFYTKLGGELAIQNPLEKIKNSLPK